MGINLKIRGIYATALTKFCTDSGLFVTSPSPQIAERFRHHPRVCPDRPADIEITDTADCQGIVLTGREDALIIVGELIRVHFIDAVFRKTDDSEDAVLEIEFPFLSKSTLDDIRQAVLPTVIHHHRLKLINTPAVDLLERRELAPHPEKRAEISRNLSARLIWDTYTAGEKLAIEHVKLDGRVIALSEGEIIACDPDSHTLVLKRARFKGRQHYDGLNVPKSTGDYAITVVTEGSLFYTHTYFRPDGTRIGEYHNISTPIECYPDRIRYVDLEVDVVRWPDGRAEIVDQEDLDWYAAAGCIGTELYARAMDTARRLLRDPP
jgi:protein associated with RNAse G/E